MMSVVLSRPSLNRHCGGEAALAAKSAFRRAKFLAWHLATPCLLKDPREDHGRQVTMPSGDRAVSEAPTESGCYESMRRRAVASGLFIVRRMRSSTVERSHRGEMHWSVL
jgi:hypothetical protein